MDHESNATHRVTIENLATGDVTERKVRSDVAAAVRTLVRGAEAPNAPYPDKLAWASDVTRDLVTRTEYRHRDLEASIEANGLTAKAQAERERLTERSEILEAAAAILEDERDDVEALA